MNKNCFIAKYNTFAHLYKILVVDLILLLLLLSMEGRYRLLTWCHVTVRHSHRSAELMLWPALQQHRNTLPTVHHGFCSQFPLSAFPLHIFSKSLSAHFSPLSESVCDTCVFFHNLKVSSIETRTTGLARKWYRRAKRCQSPLKKNNIKKHKNKKHQLCYISFSDTAA